MRYSVIPSAARNLHVAGALLLVATLAASLEAQGTKLDRTKQPAPTRTPSLKVPAWTSTTLSNGATLVVSRKADLPLVSVNINFLGGSNQFETPDKLGVATMTAQMLSEGTATRTGDQLADAQQKLGTNIRVNIGDENGSVGFTALADKLDAALDLVADMLLNPSLPADALERRRAQRLVQLTQQKDEGDVVANNVFYKTVYPDHPYGWVVNETSTKAITRDDIVAFHRNYFQPGRASITVVGDVDAARVKASFERAFAKWPAGGTRPNFAYPSTPAPKSRQIYLIDKPKAAQSSVVMGLTGPSRDTPDYYALSVMNNILGGLFQSRLNHLIREVKGYSYGVGSSFDYGRGPGAFSASGEIVTEKSDSALIDFVNELRGVQGGKPFTEDEIQQGKESLVQALPRRFASVDGVAGAISALYTQDLPQAYYQEYAAKINAVTSADLVRVAKKYIDLDNMAIVIVGDREAIEPKLRATGIAPIVLLNVDGKPVVTP
jgi:predicted Zn-dependent peptidase